MGEIVADNILLVDDESAILNSLRRCLTVRDEFHDPGGYIFHLTTDPAEALRWAENIEFDMVVSDYRMPTMDGVTLLTELSLVQPDMTAIILSGMTDMAGLIRAINQAQIYRFLPKPWDDYDLRATVASALAQHHLQRNHRLLEAKYQEQLAANKALRTELEALRGPR